MIPLQFKPAALLCRWVKPEPSAEVYFIFLPWITLVIWKNEYSLEESKTISVFPLTNDDLPSNKDLKTKHRLVQILHTLKYSTKYCIHVENKVVYIHREKSLVITTYSMSICRHLSQCINVTWSDCIILTTYKHLNIEVSGVILV